METWGNNRHKILQNLAKIFNRRRDGIRPPINPVVAARIRELRAQGLTARQVAAALGVSVATVYRYEKQGTPAPAAAPPAPQAAGAPAPDLEALAAQLEKVREIYGRLAALVVEDQRPAWERALDKLLPVVAIVLLAQLSAQNPGLAAAIQASGIGLPALQPPAPQP